MQVRDMMLPYGNESDSTDHHAFTSVMTLAVMMHDCYYIRIDDVKLPN